MWGLVIVLIINSAMSLYYYLRVVAEMFKPSGELSQAGTRDRPAHLADGRRSLAAYGTAALAGPVPLAAAEADPGNRAN